MFGARCVLQMPLITLHISHIHAPRANYTDYQVALGRSEARNPPLSTISPPVNSITFCVFPVMLETRQIINLRANQNANRMSWVTVYMRGRKGFRREVLAKLERTWLPGSHEANKDLLMFWIEDISKLRSLKIAVGSKLIFKYRLHFFTDLDSNLKAEKRQSSEFSTMETEMMTQMVQWEERNPDRRVTRGNRQL